MSYISIISILPALVIFIFAAVRAGQVLILPLKKMLKKVKVKS
jgi:hypothetical protein